MKSVLQYYEKKTCYTRQTKLQSSTTLRNTRQKIYQNLFRKICKQKQDRDFPNIFGYENGCTKIFYQEILI